MKKGYYVHFQGRQSIGVSKKIDMQIEEFSRFYEMQEVEIKTQERSLLKRVLGLWPTASILRDYKEGMEKIVDPAFLYIRRTVADKAYIKFLHDVKRKYPDCKIVIEIFTYPYDKDDFRKWNAWPFYLKERIYRPQLKKYVDRFVTYTDDKEIFGVPTIPTANGVNVEKIPLARGGFENGRLRLVAVAFMQRQHGYERIIEGIAQYYKENPGYRVELSLVGDGPEKAMYQKLVQKYGIQEYVKFYPTMSGEKLDELYDQSDIALIAFGMYKVGVYGKMSALKSRECMAKGMLMLSGSGIDVLDENYPFMKVVPNCKEPVNMDEVVKFFENITSQYPDKEVLAGNIRQIAKEKVDMSVVMKPVLEFLAKSISSR